MTKYSSNSSASWAIINTLKTRISKVGAKALILLVMRCSRYTFVCVLLTVLPIALAAQDTGPPPPSCRFQDDPADCKDAFTFFHKLKAAVSANQRDLVARMVWYPLEVYIDDKRVRIAGPQALLAHYNEIINPAERCAISTVEDTDVWGNWQGYTIDRGAIWWDKLASKKDEKPGQDIDWTKIPFKIKRFNNLNVMTQACMRLNVVQTLSPDSSGKGKGIVLIDFRPADAFFSRFQKAATSDEREKVADMVLYPVKLRIGGKQVAAKDRVRFLQLYDSAFVARAKLLLLGEHGSDLTAWWEGISDPDRLVRFAPVSGTNEFLIIELADSPPKPATEK